MYNNNQSSLLRLKHVLKLIPVCKATFWNGVKTGRFPQPVKLGRCTFWRADEIYRLIEEASEKRTIQL